jgi:hypothetical protein
VIINYLSIILLVIICILFLYGGYLVFISTKRKKGRWGVNINSPKNWIKSGISKNITCPVCREAINGNKQSKDIDEILWGGYTCSNCETKLDKWGELKRIHNGNRRQARRDSRNR